MNPFQVVAKLSMVFWDDVAYAWVNYAANAPRSSFALVSNDPANAAVRGQNVFAGQSAAIVPTLPGWTTAKGPQLFYSTQVFGPLDWTQLRARTSVVGVSLCTVATNPVCTTFPCTFGLDKPVLTPLDV